MAYCAIFDLDETIIKCKSMESILKYYYLLNSASWDEGYYKFKCHKQKLNEYAKLNNSRELLNIYYYKLLEGFSSTQIKEASFEWFRKNKDTLFNHSVEWEINKHRKAGAILIVITGSFFDCIKPILDYLSVINVICTNLEKNNDCYTGNIGMTPVIGEGKALLLAEFIRDKGLSLAQSYAYCDDISDLPLLSIVDNPVVVGSNPELSQHAYRYGWKLIN